MEDPTTDHDNDNGTDEGPLTESLETTCVHTFNRRKHASIIDLDLTIQQCQEDLRLASDGTTRAEQLQLLGDCYLDRYEASNTLSDLDECIKSYRAALDITTPDELSYTFKLANLATAIYYRARKSKHSASINECIALFEEYLSWTNLDHLPFHLHIQLTHAYQMKLRRPGSNDDHLNRCITLVEQLVHVPLRDHLSCRDYFRKLSALGRLYIRRFKRSDDMRDLEESFTIFHKASDVSEGGEVQDSGRAAVLCDLGRAFHERFLRLAQLQDLDSSIRQFEAAAEAVPRDAHPTRRHNILSSLAGGYATRYRVVGSISDLEISIRILNSALDFSSQEKELHGYTCMSLGIKYHDKFRRTGNLTDLDEAIRKSQNALDATPSDKKARITASMILGRLLGSRYKLLGNEKDILDSIGILDAALSFAQSCGDAGEVKLLDRLMNAYMDKYKRTEMQKDIETAIEYGRKAVDLLSNAGRALSDYLSSLAMAYEDKSACTQLEEDYEMAIKTLTKAIDAAPDDDPSQSGLLLRLGIQYESRFRRQNRESDLFKATEMLEKSFTHPLITIRQKVYVGRWLAEWFAEVDKPAAAYQIATETLSLVSQLVPRSLEVSDKQALLRSITRFPALVGALALTVGEEPYKAIQHLELGRGIIVGSLSELRTDTLELRTSRPDLVQRFHSLRDQLDTAPEYIVGLDNPRHAISLELDSVIENIREVPSFSRFLLPPSEEELKSAAIYGPIIIINSMHLRCDALIIQNDQITSLKLPGLYCSDEDYFIQRPQIDRETLEWLWDTVAHPILEVLGYHGPPTGSLWPRVFWILTGTVSALPIHAAGYHYPGSTETVMDRVISTYSMSVKALIQSRQNTAREESSQKRHGGKAALIGVQELHYAQEEVTELGQLCLEMDLKPQLVSPLRAEVLESLADCDIFHFAGHGEINSLNPTKSSLRMKDAPVTVEDLFNLKLYNRAPFLAYLSACSTGRMENERLSDEGLHLIGACQLAGFRNVIGTLQKVEDEYCVHVAKLTYKWIKDRDMAKESVGEGLHQAIRSLRDKWVAAGIEGGNGLRSHGKRRESSDCQSKAVSETDQDKMSREWRDIIFEGEDKVSWAPFVYFGA